MLLALTVQNLLSFKEKQELSFVTSKSTHYQENTIKVHPKIDVLTANIFVGPNDSGKTNLVKILAFVKASIHFDLETLLTSNLNSYNYNDENSLIQVAFIENNVVYEYSLEFNFKQKRLIDQTLVRYQSSNSRSQKMFSKWWDGSKYNVEFGRKLQISKYQFAHKQSIWKQNNVSLFELAEHPDIANTYNWLNKLSFAFGDYQYIPSTDIVDILNRWDFRIKSLASDYVTFENNQTIPLNYLSSGLIAAMELASQLVQAKEVLVVDNDNLRPEIVEDLIHICKQAKIQLLLLTNRTSLLNLKLRSDQVYFVDKNPKQESSLFTLWDFEHSEEYLDNLEKHYLTGRFGAVPYIAKHRQFEL